MSEESEYHLYTLELQQGNDFDVLVLPSICEGWVFPDDGGEVDDEVTKKNIELLAVLAQELSLKPIVIDATRVTLMISSAARGLLFTLVSRQERKIQLNTECRCTRQSKAAFTTCDTWVLIEKCLVITEV